MNNHQRYAVVVGIACSSAAVLIFEIALTRIFAVAQFYHFAFMTVSLALLGFGASGSALTAFPALGRGGPRRYALLAFGQSISTLGAYALTNALPFDSFSIAWDTRQVGYLVIYYLALAVPFFFGGAVVGALLSKSSLSSFSSPDSTFHSPQNMRPSPASTASAARFMPSHRVYAANLVGSGAGCLLALGGLAWLGGVGVIATAALTAMLAALCFEWASARRSIPFGAALIGSIGLMAVWMPRPPDAFDLRLSPYKDLSAALRYPGAQVITTRWNASSRVDHVLSAGIRSLPGLSFTFRGDPPPQDGLTFDGDDLSPIPRIDPQRAAFVSYLLISLPFELRPGSDALILEPRGGLDVFVALAGGARSIVAVEPNELAVEAARRTTHSGYADPRARVVLDEPRAYVERSADLFDVIDLALTAPYRPVTSGAYSLAEDYRLTAEAFDQYLSRLKPDGLLAVMRFLQTPPSEEMRLIALAAGAVRRAGGDPVQSIAALRGYSTALVLVKRSALTAGELASIRAFAESRRFDLIAAPGLRPEAANRYNVLPDDATYRMAASLLNAPDPSAVYESYPFDIAPPTDDHPFFGHFFKWSQASEVLATLGKTWQPFGGAGYFVLVALLALSSLAAMVLIIAPLGVPHPPAPSPEAELRASGEGELRSPLRTTAPEPIEGPALRSPRPEGVGSAVEGPALRSPRPEGVGSAVEGPALSAVEGPALSAVEGLSSRDPLKGAGGPGSILSEAEGVRSKRPDHKLAPKLKYTRFGPRAWTLSYFGLLGLGFLFVEIPLVQQYILLVGRPTTSLAVVLFTLLIASGLGSLASRRVPWRAGALVLAVAIALYPSLIRTLTSAILFAPVEARLAAGGLALAPLGFMMGTMFPKGIAHLEGRAPELVPWAWGINGAASVISAAASALLALTFGFSAVIALGAACYGACSLLVRGTKLTAPRL